MEKVGCLCLDLIKHNANVRYSLEIIEVLHVWEAVVFGR